MSYSFTRIKGAEAFASGPIRSYHFTWYQSQLLCELSDVSQELLREFRVTEKFDGEDYHMWKLRMQLYLEELDLFDVIIGVPPHATAPQSDKDAWNKNDQKVHCQIFLTLTNGELRKLARCSTSKEVWEQLKEAYESSSMANRVHLRWKLFSMTFDEGGSMKDHLAEVCGVIDQLLAVVMFKGIEPPTSGVAGMTLNRKGYNDQDGT